MNPTKRTLTRRIDSLGDRHGDDGLPVANVTTILSSLHSGKEVKHVRGEHRIAIDGDLYRIGPVVWKKLFPDGEWYGDYASDRQTERGTA